MEQEKLYMCCASVTNLQDLCQACKDEYETYILEKAKAEESWDEVG